MTADNKKNKKPQIKWTRAVPLRRPDYIKSSVFTERGEVGFTPTYDHGRPNLGCLLNYEYMRMWFKERDQYQKDTYTKQDKKADSFVKRRHVQRYTRHTEKQKILPIVTIKKFQNVQGIESTAREGVKLQGGTKAFTYVQKAEEEKGKQFLKYKPDCSRPKKKAITKEE
ncbi:uncharacterized protein LOC123311768 [Coccinella septempunctata]|uniref:uncharacterized protein LOC123311768 n=1 Tax=Coccinella septempunctata TaxID=41139 RepID=UPI001D062FD6|nr:uncharacterized protein LOC123311768 [Coccinella septempunctata]